MAAYLVTGLDGLAFGLLLFVVAAGLTLIFGVLDVLNLAHGSLYLAGAYLAYQCTAAPGAGGLGAGGLGGWGPGGGLFGLAVAVAAGAVLGAGGGAALAVLLRPLTGPGRHLEQALATLGIAHLAVDGYTSWFGGAPLPVEPPEHLGGSIGVGGHGYPVYRLGFIAVAALLAAGLHLAIRHSTSGIRLRATVADPAMAAATGIHVRQLRAVAMAAGAALAVVAGVLGAPLLGPAPGVDTTVLVLSLIVVVIGGAGSIPGTLGAAMLVGQVQTLGVLAAPTLAPFALFTVLLAALAARTRTAAPGRPA